VYTAKTDKTVNMEVKAKKGGASATATTSDPDAMIERYVLLAGNVKVTRRQLLAHPLTQHPAAFFDKDGVMNKPSKHLMALHLRDTYDTSEPSYDRATCNKTDANPAGEPIKHAVVDTMANVRRSTWAAGASCASQADAHVKRVLAHHACGDRAAPSVWMVTDGYDPAELSLSTKSACQQQRAKAPCANVTVDPAGAAVHNGDRDLFLSNLHNKRQYVNLLSNTFKNAGINVVNCKADADVPIVMKALELAKDAPTLLVAEDADLYVIAAHHFNPSVHTNLFIYPEDKYSSTATPPTNVRAMCANMAACTGGDLAQVALACHGAYGCDTVSAVAYMGQTTPFKLAATNSEFHSLMRSHYAEFRSTVHDIAKFQGELVASAERALVMLCRGDHAHDVGLNELRFQRFAKSVLSSSMAKANMKMVPPCQSSFREHTLRAYLQVQEWLQQSGDLDPTQWGFNKLIVPTNSAPLLLVTPGSRVEVVGLGTRKANGQCGTVGAATTTAGETTWAVTLQNNKVVNLPVGNLAAAVVVLAPVPYRGPMAPKPLLDLSRCKACKPDTEGACKQCACVKVGLRCTELCACKGECCSNSAELADDGGAAEVVVADEVADDAVDVTADDVDDMEDVEIAQLLRDMGLDPTGRRRTAAKRLQAALRSGAEARRQPGESEADWLTRVLERDFVAEARSHADAQDAADQSDDVARAQVFKQWGSSRGQDIGQACARAGLDCNSVLEKLCRLADEGQR